MNERIRQFDPPNLCWQNSYNAPSATSLSTASFWPVKSSFRFDDFAPNNQVRIDEHWMAK
jgi:hypothetical protein